jgi:hypothetical protein
MGGNRLRRFSSLLKLLKVRHHRINGRVLGQEESQ